jgi:hypothetical protein
MTFGVRDLKVIFRIAGLKKERYLTREVVGNGSEPLLHGVRLAKTFAYENYWSGEACACLQYIFGSEEAKDPLFVEGIRTVIGEFMAPAEKFDDFNERQWIAGSILKKCLKKYLL